MTINYFGDNRHNKMTMPIGRDDWKLGRHIEDKKINHEWVDSTKCLNMRGVGQNRDTVPIPSYRTIKYSSVLVGGSNILLVTKKTCTSGKRENRWGVYGFSCCWH